MKHDQLHVLSYGKLALVLAALLLLTVATVAVSRIDLGVLNIWIALLIAGTKSSLVLLFFMHLKYEGPVLKYSLLMTVLIVVMVISFVFWDVAFR